MKRFFVLIFVVFWVCSVFAEGHGDVLRHRSCKYCGMDREQYAYSRTLITYDDGTEVGFCSIHCAAIDLASNIDKIVKKIEVADYNIKN